MFTVFDEIHHASEDNEWGSASERLARCSTKILGMTGTPFRGDRRKISFVSYDDKGCAKADFEYAYRDAVNENVCRPVQFMTDDGIAEFIMYQEQEKVRLSEAITDDHVRGASGTIFRSDSNWMKAFIERADASIDEYRNIDADAGGLIVCRPGIDEERDERYLRQIAKLVKDVTGENPEVVSHEDPDANAKIEKFRTSTQRWICAVRKISEGVDIKRLRVLVMATRPTTELLFRQLVGRIVRVKNPQSNNPEKREYATAYIAKFPQLKEWAEKLAEEAEAGLAEKPKERKPSDDPDPTSSMFTALGSTHEKGGAISDYGDQFTAAEINAAEKDKNGDPQLLDIPITKLAYLRRKFGMIANDEQTSNDPLQIEKKRIRDEINKTARRLAIKRSPDNPDYRIVWRDLHKHTGARNIDDLMDNHSIDVMRQALHLIHGWLGGKDAVA
jgi:superfamily II DNA or RNA helicase